MGVLCSFRVMRYSIDERVGVLSKDEVGRVRQKRGLDHQRIPYMNHEFEEGQ